MTLFRDELTRRTKAPQRHRLLQGFPMLPLMRWAVPPPWHGMRRADGSLLIAREVRTPDAEGPPPANEPPWVTLDPTRPLIVGVLPHAQCNPTVAGCGFCTFPHDPYHKRELRWTAGNVAAQINQLFLTQPALAKRRVEAVYFGGATANLTPADDLAAIGHALCRHLDLRHAELTLEGVPSLFRSLLRGPFDAFLAMPARHRRLSMGVQTFDEAMLARMGRSHFGDRRDIEKVLDKAHRKGLTVSGDFLFNLPSQPRSAMLADLRKAAAMGFDQICAYHLVLTEGQGIPWAKDPAVLAALPSPDEACKNWLAVRKTLLSLGYVQTTLTNFERAEIHATERRFLYEERSFSPELYDALGFGPLGIATFTDLTRRRAVKLSRARAVVSSGGWTPEDLFFPYGEEDLRLLFVTRTLARTRIPRATYRDLFGADLAEHFGGAIAAVVAARLATFDEEALTLTPRGMFYADAVAGLLAWPRVTALRASGAGQHTRDVLTRRDLDHDHMG